MFLEGKTLELMIAAVVALVVVGPKDLPILLRRFGQFMAKLRGMAAEFRASFDEMARQSELDELRKEVEALRKGQLAEIAAAAPTAEINQTFDEIHQGLADVGVQLNTTSQPYVPPADTGLAPQTTIAAAEPAPKPKPRAKAKTAAPTKTPKKPAAKKAASATPRAKPARRKP